MFCKTKEYKIEIDELTKTVEKLQKQLDQETVHKLCDKKFQLFRHFFVTDPKSYYSPERSRDQNPTNPTGSMDRVVRCDPRFGLDVDRCEIT